ncbi:MAG TPA: hypothetical protein VK970_11180, partial [Candidatus Methylacidiphilales bacterium]|nr:hypothetical protein [Candidatus Methylacidiphilales bacterium]
NGSQYAMTHNMRLAILSFALWRARHPGRLPASLDDFLDEETRAAFIPVEGVKLEYHDEMSGTIYHRTCVRCVVDPAVAPLLDLGPFIVVCLGKDVQK